MEEEPPQQNRRQEHRQQDGGGQASPPPAEEEFPPHLPGGLAAPVRVQVGAAVDDGEVAGPVGPALQQLAQGDAQRVDVRALVGLGEAVLLRGGVPPGAQQLRVLLQVVPGHAGGVEVDEADVPVPGQKNVGGLDVPVNDALPVEEGQDGAKLPGNLEEPPLRQIRGAQGGPVHVLLHHRGGLLVQANLVELGQKGVGAVPQDRVDIVPPRQGFLNKHLPAAPLAHQAHRVPLAPAEQADLCAVHDFHIPSCHMVSERV